MVGVVAAALLGVAMLLAGGAKRASPAWPAQAAELGAPRWSIPVVPWLELVLGALLVGQILRPAVALVTAGLLVAFTVLLVARLLEGRHPPCACFGPWSSRPISWRSVARNVVLVALALTAAVG